MKVQLLFFEKIKKWFKNDYLILKYLIKLLKTYLKQLNIQEVALLWYTLGIYEMSKNKVNRLLAIWYISNFVNKQDR